MFILGATCSKKKSYKSIKEDAEKIMGDSGTTEGAKKQGAIIKAQGSESVTI